jgi:CRISPR-associated protein Cmr2
MPAQQYLFLFTIGPVQGFIEQARKTRDLFAGSQILSELTGAAMIKVSESNGTDPFFFPHKDSTSKPNRFLAKVSTDDIQSFGDTIEVAVRTKWAQLSTESFHSAGLSENLSILDKALIADLSKQSCLELIARQSSIAARQIAEFPDVYWAAIEYDGSEYVSKLRKLEQLLAGVKNVRIFCQLGETKGSRKCSLDGERTALFYRYDIDANEKPRKPNFLSDESNSIKGTLLDPGEALSAVSLVKRYYQKANGGFPSTAQIALMDRIDENWETTYKKYFSGDVDYQLFFEENLTETGLKKKGIRKKTDAHIDEISKVFREFTGKKPTKYYALLLFDGDDFGKLWSGVRLLEVSGLKEFQEKLAVCLHEYAKAARNRLDKPKGQTVYTAGDDFLGFVNLNSLIDVMDDLRKAFDKVVSEPLKEYLKGEKAITFTAGVAIAHYKTPLGEVLKKARATEKRAKEHPGKDTYGIAVVKHSGEVRDGFLPFNDFGQTDTLDALKRLIYGLKKQDGFSNTFIHAFAREMHSLMDREDGKSEKDREVGLNDSALSTELGRLLSRSAKTFGNEREKAVNDCLKVVDSLRHASERALEGELGMKNFLSLLDICDFIKRETSRDQL